LESAVSSSGENELTDDDFIRREEPDTLEELRQYIRQRLRQGVPQREIADELTTQGLDPTSPRMPWLSGLRRVTTAGPITIRAASL
jgi:hypothetical protein